jgi:Txe/YoeB family toxin of Txe-Axe toxin-antitoxin module
MKLSEGNNWNYDYETFVSFDTPAREAYRKAKARQTDDNKLQKRIESRPPTIYKGTWRDTGKCEKVEYNKMFDR